MGIFGTYGAFQGLGKPSIKLEFEDNEDLLDFQRRMQEGGDGGNYTQSQLDDAVDEHNTIGWGIKPEIPEGWHVVKTKSAPDGFDVIVKGEPSFKLTTTGWSFKNAMDAALVEKKKGLKATKGGELEGITIKDFYTAILSDAEKITPKHFSYQLLDKEFGKDKDGVYDVVTPVGTVKFYKSSLFERNHHILNHIEDNFNVLKPTLANPTIVFEGENKGFETVSFVKPFNIRGKNKIIMFSAVEPKTYRLKTIFEPETVDENYIWRQYTKGGEKRLYTKKSVLSYFEPDTPQNDSLGDSVFPFEVVNILLPCNITENGAKSCIFNENSLGAPGDTYIITDTRKKPRKELNDVTALKRYDIRKLTGEELAKMQTEDPLLYEQIKSDLQQQKTPIKQEVKTKEDWMREVDEMLETWKEEAFRKTTPQKLDEPGSRVKARYISNLRDIIIKYFIEEIDKGNFERVSNIANILGYKYADNERIAQTNGLISQFVGIVPTLPEGWRISKNIPKWLPKLPKGYIYIDNGKEMFDYRHKIMPTQKGLGKTANPAIYNNNDIMECRGLVPTYTILDDYSSFFEQAKTHTEFAGFGLDDTLKLITDICRKHWKDCAKIAQHLKGDCKLQSAFNLWHWMRYNIRYEYDREGREEVRTPLRVWADRMRGVDCDCLSVFAYCVLRCMGYNPAFELVAFRNKPQYSHIFINLDGIVVDRVWFIFNSRPPMVTKSTIYRINDINDLGKLF